MDSTTPGMPCWAKRPTSIFTSVAVRPSASAFHTEIGDRRYVWTCSGAVTSSAYGRERLARLVVARVVRVDEDRAVALDDQGVVGAEQAGFSGAGAVPSKGDPRGGGRAGSLPRPSDGGGRARPASRIPRAAFLAPYGMRRHAYRGGGYKKGA